MLKVSAVSSVNVSPLLQLPGEYLFRGLAPGTKSGRHVGTEPQTDCCVKYINPSSYAHFGIESKSDSGETVLPFLRLRFSFFLFLSRFLSFFLSFFFSHFFFFFGCSLVSGFVLIWCMFLLGFVFVCLFFKGLANSNC